MPVVGVIKTYDNSFTNRWKDFGETFSLHAVNMVPGVTNNYMSLGCLGNVL